MTITIDPSKCYFAVRAAWPGATLAESRVSWHRLTPEQRRLVCEHDQALRERGDAYPTTREWYGRDGSVPDAAAWAWGVDGLPIRGSEPCPISLGAMHDRICMGAEWALAGSPSEDLRATLAGAPRPWGTITIAA